MIKFLIYILFILSTNIFANNDTIIAPKRYKPAEMNIEVTKIKTKEIDGTINFQKKELSIKKSDINPINQEEFLFLTTDPKKNSKISFKNSQKETSNLYIFDLSKDLKENIYLIHSNKDKIINIYSLNLLNVTGDYSQIYFFIPQNNKKIYLEGYPTNEYFDFYEGYCLYKIDATYFPDFTIFESDDRHLIPDGYRVYPISNRIIEIISSNSNDNTIFAKLEIDENFKLRVYLKENFPKETFKIYYRNFDVSNHRSGVIIINGNTADEELIKEIQHIDFGELKLDSNNNVQGTAEGFIIFNNLAHKNIELEYAIPNIKIHLKDLSKNLNVTLSEPISHARYKFTLPAHIVLQPGTPGIYKGTANLKIILTDKNQGGKF